MELAKTYNPSEVEDKWYRYWMTNGYFKADANSAKPKYSIVIPPPNVTGVLHMGHMLNNTIQDVLIRRARMQGFETCWVPGTDHASIATEAKVVSMLREKGIDKKGLGREEFLKYAWEWKEKYGGIILEQLKKLGASCDWDRTRFTMEPSLSEAVTDVFIDLYNKGLIYRGQRMVNWDPQALTSISDEEVIPKDTTLKLYYVRYAIKDEKDTYITIATSRPETIMADAAVCIHPQDERYTHLHGKTAIIPLINREIPVILDEYVSMEFGTGCLKVTPAHDKNDYELGVKHKLPIIDILNENGTLNEQAIIHAGEDRFVARKKIAKELEEQGYIEKVEDYASQVSTSERTGAIVEPRISMQWFVDMQKFVAKNPQVLSDVLEDEIRFHPAKFKNVYKYWIENIKDWCISRQLWWGQRIPAWYAPDGKYEVAKTAEEAVKKFHARNLPVELSQLKQDEDVVDTWFSSWLWPISVFDGFEKPGNPDIKAFYPTHTLVTAPEIIFFWVARMIMAGYEYQQEKPFQHVYFTGIVRDKLRRKMSKSLGNSPDPLDLVAKFGADAVRMGMLLCSPAGNDVLYDESMVEQGRNFNNKIWNAYRLIKGWEVIADEAETPETVEANKLAGKWMRAKFNAGLRDIEEKFADYKLSEALMSTYKLVWDDFCAWYLEMIKPEYGKPINAGALQEAKDIFGDLLKLVHPFMPFISEELYHDLHDGKPSQPLIATTWPAANADAKEVSSLAIACITEIRNARNSKGISPKERLKISIALADARNKEIYDQFASIIRKLGNIEPINFVTEAPANAIQALVDKDALYIHMDGQIDEEEERKKIAEEISYLEGFLKSVEAKLSNEKFVANAKTEIVEKERQKKADAETKLQVLKSNLSTLN